MYIGDVVKVMNETENINCGMTYAGLGVQIDSIRFARGYSRLEVAKGIEVSNVRT